MHTCGTYMYVMYHMCMYTYQVHEDQDYMCHCEDTCGTSEFTETLFTNFSCVPVYRYTGSPHSGNRLILTFTYMYVRVHTCMCAHLTCSLSPNSVTIVLFPIVETAGCFLTVF